MRIQLRSLIAALVAVSVCSGSIGCKSNGGTWYKPSSYSFHNPFKKDFSSEDEFGLAAAEDSSGKLPSDGQKPDLDIPPGGYGSSGAKPKSSTTTSVASTGSTTTGATSTGIQRTGTPASSFSANQQPSVAMNNQSVGSYSPTYPPSGTQQAGATMQSPNTNYTGQYQQTSAVGSYNTNPPAHGAYNGGYPNAPTAQNAATTQYPTNTGYDMQQPSYGTQPQQGAYSTSQQQYSAPQQQQVYPTQNNTYNDPYSQYNTPQSAPATGTTQTNYSQSGYSDYRPGSF